MFGLNNALLAAVVALAISASNAFTVAPATSISGTSSTQLLMSATAPPAQEQVVASSTMTPPSSSASNLPSQKELLSKSNNLASGAGLSISDLRFNGDVPKTEADEFIQLTNGGNTPLDISKYYVYVATTGTQGPTYYFPKGTVLKSGQSIRVYTNQVNMATGGYTFGSGKAIWSNNGGLAVLKDDKGKKVGEYKYKPN